MKLLASDFDRTLCFNQTVMEEDLQAIKEWREQGNLFVLVTGRSRQAIEEQMKIHGIEADYVVCGCGSIVFNSKGELMQAVHLDSITGMDIIYIAKETEGVASVLVNEETGSHRLVISPDLRDSVFAGMEPNMKEEEVLDLPHYTQVVVSLATQDEALAFTDEMNNYFSSTVKAYPNGYAVDIVAKDVSKATGVEFIKEYENIDIDDVYTIGDSYNDLPLIRYGSNGGVMFNAPSDMANDFEKTYFSVKQYIEDCE